MMEPRHSDGNGAQDDRRPHGNQTLLRLLEQAREERGSPSLWDAVAARLDEEERLRDVVEPISELLQQIQERVDVETWRLVLDLELRFSNEIMAGVEVGVELGYEHGRAAVLLDAERVPGNAAQTLTGRLADLLGDTEAGYLDVVLALLATLEATVRMAHGGPMLCELGLAGTDEAWDSYTASTTLEPDTLPATLAPLATAPAILRAYWDQHPKDERCGWTRVPSTGPAREHLDALVRSHQAKPHP